MISKKTHVALQNLKTFGMENGSLSTLVDENK